MQKLLTVLFYPIKDHLQHVKLTLSTSCTIPVGLCMFVVAHRISSEKILLRKCIDDRILSRWTPNNSESPLVYSTPFFRWKC